MAKRRTEIWLGVAVLGVLLIPIGIAGLWLFMSTTAVTLHPNPQDVRSVAEDAAAQQWATAVEQARQVVRSALSEQNLPGMSAAVGIDGGIVWAEGFGWAALESEAPVAPTTRFRIGTASTLLTSAAVGLLLEEGQLELDEPIRTYVPEVPESQRDATLRQVMAHVAGIPNDGGDEGPLFSKRCERPADAFQHLSGFERRRRFEPGTDFRYSSYGWIAVSAAVEAASRQPFLTFMWTRVFEPLGIRDTEADSIADPIPSATSYFPRFASDPTYGLHLMRRLDLSCYAGASVFLSTPSDLVRFGMGINAGKLLKTDTVQQLQTTERLTSGEETGYGLGWDLETVTLGGAPAQSIGHEGRLLGGPVASVKTFPQLGMAVAVIANISYADVEGVALKIAEAFSDRAREGGR